MSDKLNSNPQPDSSQPTAAQVAAKWWADKLRGGISPVRSGDSNIDLMLMFVTLKTTTPEPDDKISHFEFALASFIQVELDRQGQSDWQFKPCVTLDTDYSAGYELSRIGEMVGVSLKTLPIKTVMWVYLNKVSVSEGYGRQPVTIYEARRD